MDTTSKSRTPSRCREWERQRRNKFNEAITKLGEAVRAVNRDSNAPEKDGDNVQMPKIEIVQKAIIILTNCAQEKTQLSDKREECIEQLVAKVSLTLNQYCCLAEVKIESTEKSKKDASTQVHVKYKKHKNGKYVKLLMLQKPKRNALKEKSVLTTNVTVKPDSQKEKSAKNNRLPKILPKLLPNTQLNKKMSENTIVVVPAAPYLFPQRSLFLPAAPPTFVLVDPNMPSLNKTSVPIVNRNGGDTTKTTMVNILPISAYSRPLSATKTKKTNTKPKSAGLKKRKLKTPKVIKQIKGINNVINNAKSNLMIINKTNKSMVAQDTKEVSIEDKGDMIIKIPDINNSALENSDNAETPNNDDISSKDKDAIDKIVSISNDTAVSVKPIENVNFNQSEKSVAINRTEEVYKEVNICTKPTTVANKDKENKLPNILETSICENGVDGGNARLELAEEFLAASPTAAFLMSFPLVSGNRADSPAEETANSVHTNLKEHPTPQLVIPPTTTSSFFEKSSTNAVKTKNIPKQQAAPSIIPDKQPVQQTHVSGESNVISKQAEIKTSNAILTSSENPFLSLSMPSIIISTTQSDVFGLDFDCSTIKSVPSQSSSYVSSSNFFYKGDPFNTVKSSIYSTSSIASGHEFNSLGLYPCAMEKYSKNKSDYTNVEDNLMKIGSSRLTYDIDLGWSHKGFEFVNCSTNANTFSKDILTTATASSYGTSYNPFNPEFHVPLVTTSNKKDTSNKPIASFAESITNFYSAPQTANLWAEDMCFYNNNSAPKTLPNKHQNYLHIDPVQTNASIRPAQAKQYDSKPDAGLQNTLKTPNDAIRHLTPDKYNKKSPNKMHINWMTSELRPMQNNCNQLQTISKEPHKQTYSSTEHNSKKQEHSEGNYFPIAMHNFSAQPSQDDFQVWPSARPLGTTEISIEPPPINLPTLIGDLALGPHDKKKTVDITNRVSAQTDIQNCGNFLSVTQLMNRSSEVTSRYHGSNSDVPKSAPAKQYHMQFNNDISRKLMSSNVESNTPQPCYVFNDLKPIHSYENMGQFSQPKPKTNKSDKSAKVQKHSYSAEALIRSGTCTQKGPDHIGPKYSTQKYSDFNTQDTSVAQVSHFPPIGLDYSDNSYTGQQFSGTTLYNSTANTISNSFYSNFMSGSANIMSGTYTSAPFTGDFMEYNQAECNYSNNKYEEFKMRGNPTVFQEKNPSNYKSSRRESGVKHKLECSKKESSKKYQNKRVKLSSEVEEWNDANLFWQNKGQNKKQPNIMSEELTFPNYVGNQMPQYQHELFNSPLVAGGVQPGAFPATSRANFNLSTIFPEITMKVQ